MKFYVTVIVTCYLYSISLVSNRKWTLMGLYIKMTLLQLMKCKSVLLL